MCTIHWPPPRVQEAIKVVNEVMLSRGISLPLDSQRRIEEGDRFDKGREMQFPIYGDRIKQTLSDLPEEQREAIPRYLTELCFGDFYTRGGLDLRTRGLLILCVLPALGGTDLQISRTPLEILRSAIAAIPWYQPLLSVFLSSDSQEP